MERAQVEQAIAGDKGAYEHLARTVARPLFLVAHRILRDSDAAEDAVQQTLVTIWRELPRLRDADKFDAWTYRLIVRASLAEAKRQKRQTMVRELQPTEPITPDASSQVATRDDLERAFQGLTPEHRAVVVLHYYVGMPIAEIAATLGVPYGTVGSRLHYAVRSMRAVLGADGPQRPTGGRTGGEEAVLAGGRMA